MITPIRGHVYVIHHSSGNIRTRFIESTTHAGSDNTNARTRYLFQNLSTGRDIVIKSRVKIRREVTE